MKKEKSMPKTQVGEADAPEAVVSLAFRVVPDAEGLFAAQILLLKDDVVAEKRTGVYTTLGHAIGAADDLMDGWAFNEIEQKAEDYFRAVFL
jgi:hypothetical protein